MKIKIIVTVIIIWLVGYANFIFASNYKHFPNAAISGYNTKHLSNASVQDCMSDCDKEDWCRSFDYYKGQNCCDLSNKKASDVGGLKTNYSGNPYDHFEKISP